MNESRKPRPAPLAALQRMLTRQPQPSQQPKPSMTPAPRPPTPLNRPVQPVAALPQSVKRDAQAIGANLQKASVAGTQQIQPKPVPADGGGARRAIQPVAPNQLTLERQAASRNSVAPTAKSSLTPAQPKKPVAVAKSDLGAIKPQPTPRPSLTNQQMMAAPNSQQQGRTR